MYNCKRLFLPYRLVRLVQIFKKRSNHIILKFLCLIKSVTVYRTKHNRAIEEKFMNLKFSKSFRNFALVKLKFDSSEEKDQKSYEKSQVKILNCSVHPSLSKNQGDHSHSSQAETCNTGFHSDY